MKKFFALMLAFAMMLSLAACGGGQSSAPAPAAPAEQPSSGEGKVYTFVESVMGAFEVEWTLELKEDGSFVLTENNPVMGQRQYTGTYTADGSHVTTGPLEGGTPQAGFFNGDLSCEWVLDEQAGTVTPVNYDAETTGELPDLPEGGLPGEGAVSDADIPNLAYAADSASQVLDLYLPEHSTGADPVIVLVHGGGFKFGSQTMEILRPVIEAGTERGYVVASVDYRKSGEAVFPAALSDVKAAVRFLKANAAEYGIDPEKVVIWGESAGAYLSLMTAMTPEAEELNGDVKEHLEYSSGVAALVDFYGPVEFYTMDAEYAALGREGTSYSSANSFESAFLGRPVGEDEAFTYTTWWGTYLDRLPENFTLSAWVQAGDADSSVPCTQSQNFAGELAEVLGEDSVHFELIPGAEHEDELFYTEDNLARVFDFLAGALA